MFFEYCKLLDLVHKIYDANLFLTSSMSIYMNVPNFLHKTGICMFICVTFNDVFDLAEDVLGYLNTLL